MRSKTWKIRLVWGMSAALLPLVWACLGEVYLNQTKERAGNVSMVFINSTPHRAIFTVGTWDAWDRLGPGPIQLDFLRLAGNSTSGVFSLACRRNAAVGTEKLVKRALDTDADDADDFDANAFGAQVRFSSAPTDSEAADLPTAGTAEGREVLLGVDYSCADRLVFTFVEDPAAPGGFRVDFEVIRDVEID